MKVENINSYSYKKYNTFKSTNRTFFQRSAVRSFCQGEVSNFTYPFRKDIDDWFALAKYVVENFKNKDKINVYSLACSDGSEAYTLAIVLKDLIKNKKVFPIIAVDKDSDIIEHANGGRINLTCEDIIRIRDFLGDNQKYFTDIKDEAIIKDSKKQVINDWDYSFPKYYSYKVDKNLRSLVDFKSENLLNTLSKLQDDSNTFISCRNVIPYLTKPEQNKLFNFLETKLKKGSLVAVGKYDERVDAEEMLRRGGFEETDIWFLYKKV